MSDEEYYRKAERETEQLGRPAAGLQPLKFWREMVGAEPDAEDVRLRRAAVVEAVLRRRAKNGDIPDEWLEEYYGGEKPGYYERAGTPENPGCWAPPTVAAVLAVVFVLAVPAVAWLINQVK